MTKTVTPRDVADYWRRWASHLGGRRQAVEEAIQRARRGLPWRGRTER